MSAYENASKVYHFDVIKKNRNRLWRGKVKVANCSKWGIEKNPLAPLLLQKRQKSAPLVDMKLFNQVLIRENGEGWIFNVYSIFRLNLIINWVFLVEKTGYIF